MYVDCKQIVSEGVDWIHVAGRVKRRAVVNTERNFGLKMRAMFLAR